MSHQLNNSSSNITWKCCHREKVERTEPHLTVMTKNAFMQFLN